MTVLIAPDGREYRTSNVVEIKRLIMAQGYKEKAGTFHPADHNVIDVVAYIKKHPEERDRIVAEELQGQKRTTITGANDTED